MELTKFRYKLRSIISRNLTFLLLFLLIVFYAYHDITKWSIMKFLGAQGPILYVDTSTVLYYSRCFENIGVSVFLSGDSCSNWNYGTSILRLLAFLELQTTDAQLIGRVLTYSLLLIFCVLVYLARGYAVAQVTLFLGLISPPVWLLMERGNFDSVIYMLIFLSALIYARGYKVSPILLVSISSILKFYTLPLLFFILVRSRGAYIKIFNLIALLVCFVIIFRDLQLLDKNNIIQAGNNHFGLKIIGNYIGKLGIEVNLETQYLISIFLFVVSLVIVYFLVLRSPFTNFVSANLLVLRFMHLFCFIVLVSIYLIGLSVDYKLIFVMATVPFLIIHSRRKLQYLISLLFLMSVWFTYLTGIFQTVGDFALQLYIAIQLVFVLQITSLKSFIKFALYKRVLNKI